MAKTNEQTKEEKKIFAKGLSKEKLFLIFVIGSIIGAYYEEILSGIKYFNVYHVLKWFPRRGVLYGPFSPIYGAGMVLFIYLLSRRKHTNIELILYGGLIGGIFEYMTSFLQETFIGTVSWDYSKQFLNIHGRTTIPIMLGWGMGAFILVRYVYPFLSRLIEKIPYKLGKGITLFLAIFLGLDMLVSWTALARWTFRRENIPPYTVVGKFYDQVYTDEVLMRHFPNMQVKE